MRHLRHLAREERGNAVVEGAVYLTGLVLLVGLIILGGRLALARQALNHVAFQAARTASLQRDAGTAQTEAQSQAAATLANQHLTCVSSSTSVDVSGFGAPLGEPASVTAMTTCSMPLGSLLGSTTITIRSTATSPIDSWRAR
ncbi:pilus assembly protein [Luteococcus sp.]|uniref:pilus assembly protein n=1 Tax=Luteococcus sp. TaxID=1969402 RepID=UPI0037353B8C